MAHYSRRKRELIKPKSKAIHYVQCGFEYGRAALPAVFGVFGFAPILILAGLAVFESIGWNDVSIWPKEVSGFRRGGNYAGLALRPGATVSRDSDFGDAMLVGADLAFVNLNHVNLSRADLSDANLRGAKLQHADLKEAKFSRSTLFRGVDLEGADLSGVDLSNFDLDDAKLARVKLVRANLAGSKLTQASLSGADLIEANLNNADLLGADLTGAHLKNATLNQDFHFGPGTVTGHTPAAPNTTSFRAEPCTSPPPVGARARPSAHRR